MKLLTTFSPPGAGLAVCPNGDVFVTREGPNEVWRIPKGGGEAARYVATPGTVPAGIVCDEKNRLFVSMFALRDSTTYKSLSVLLIADAQTPPVQLPAPKTGETTATPNGLALGPKSILYMTDTVGGVIYRIREVMPGTFETTSVVKDLTGPIAAAYDPAAKKLHVALATGMRVVTFKVADDGALSEQTTLATVEPGLLSGIALDEKGTVYVSEQLTGNVLRVPGSEAVATAMRPAGLAFRGGKLWFTEFFEAESNMSGGLYEIALGVCGADVLKARR